MPLHIRLKRKDTTVFMLCEKTDTMRKLKAQLGDALKVPPHSLRLYKGDKEHHLEDEVRDTDSARLYLLRALVA